MPPVPTYIGACCREWTLAYGGRGTCGICEQVPVYVRHDQPPLTEVGTQLCDHGTRLDACDWCAA